MKTTIITALFSLVIVIPCFGQLNYIGLKEVLAVPDSLNLNLKCQIIDDSLYVPTYSGIYRKNLTEINDTLWELFAFENIPIKDFIKNGNKILAITSNMYDSLLLISHDNGNSYTNYTNNHFFEYEDSNLLHRISQNNPNPNSIIVLHSHYGISKSVDFGLTWTNLNALSGGYQDRFVDFHPTDTSTMYYAGETEYFSSYIQTSFDNGTSWINTQEIHNNCTHQLAFHPSNPDVILAGSEGKISKSIDKGQTWNTPIDLEEYLYIYKIIFDQNNENIVYATGAFNNFYNPIVIFKSNNCGDSWNIVYREATNYGGVIDMFQFQNKLVFITRKEGVFTLDNSLVSSLIYYEEPQFIIYPNPVEAQLYFSEIDNLNKIEFLDVYGKTVKTIITGQDYGNNIDVSDLSKGFYLVVFFTNENKIIKKIIMN